MKARRLKYIGDLTKEKLKGMHSKLVPDGQWTSLDQNQLLSYFLAPKGLFTNYVYKTR